MIFNGPDNLEKLSLLVGRFGPPFNTWFIVSTRLSSDGILIGSAVFAGLTNVTNRQTHRQTTLLHLRQQATSSYCCNAA